MFKQRRGTSRALSQHKSPNLNKIRALLLFNSLFHVCFAILVEMKDTAINFLSILPKNLHHAYVIEGGEGIKEKLLKFIEGLGIKTKGNPDVYIREFDVFGINDGRAVQALESNKAVIADKKIFILRVNSITREAQNALLKTFEEPTAGTHFFLIIPSANVLLDTLISRVQVVDMKEYSSEKFSDKSNESAGSIFAKQFLSSSPAERLALISDIIESKDKQEALFLVNSLETELYIKGSMGNLEKDINKEDNIPTEVFESLQSTRSYLNDSSSSVKLLLEHLSVTLPRVE